MTVNKNQPNAPLQRIEFGHQSVEERIKHFGDFTIALDDEQIHQQSMRCLHCGTPFCSASCPLHNRPVDFNRLVRDGKWRAAWECLNSTSSFPEFTSRVCPAICEAGCTQYYLEDSAVGIKTIERAIIDRAWLSGWVKPVKPLVKTGKRVAVVGSGPAGLACAQQLARAGHKVTVYEKNEKAGGLLRYGIPDFKLPKDLIDRRIEQMQAEGVAFKFGTAVGVKSFSQGVFSQAQKTVSADKLKRDYDAVVLACGSETPRDLKVPGREAKGVHFALELLIGQNRAVSGELDETPISCKDCKVVIIGGGDTGNDCVGTSIRLGAKSVTQLEMMPKAPDQRAENNPWPEWPKICKTDYGQEEAIAVFGHDPRIYQTTVTEFIKNKKGEVCQIKTVKLTPKKDEKSGRMMMVPVEGTEEILPADLVLIAAGFLGSQKYVTDAFKVEVNQRTNVKTDDGKYQTTKENVFTAGDMHRGQSLVVWAIREGREAAKAVDESLMGYTNL